ncbi:MAG: ATP-binding protein [Allosphingosinicella sp.]|uniref:sensor histidine kinase n=1 Tax=Allosphingosinicella sp. TaxID=2823234 RepID=UPI00393F9889
MTKRPRRTAAEGAVPAFPLRAMLLGIAAMVLIAIASASTAWVVGQRVRAITETQLAVQTGAEQLQWQSELLELSAAAAIATGDEAHALRYGAVQPELRRTLEELERAIQLPENRAAIAAVARAEREISDLEYRALDLAVTDRRDEARAMLQSARYRELVRAYRGGLVEIQERSLRHVRELRQDTDRWLRLDVGVNLAGLLLIALAWLVIVRPARNWAGQLADARRRAERATRAKSDFLAVMSHEIRTPLNSVIGFADLLLTDPDVRGKQRRQVELIQGAGTMLLTVVNDLLDFSKIEAGRIELSPEPFAIETLVDNSVSIVRDSAQAKGLEMRVSVDPCLSPYFLGDENRIRQVLLNLLNNAVKFTAEGMVSLHVRREAEESGRERIRFTVTDTGSGIDATRQRRLFRPFVQADASITRRYGGTGLGLSISKRLVELMGGEIDFLSQEGEGSSFWFTLALPRADKPALAADAAEAAAVRGARILVAEDLPMNQELAKAMLGRAGHEVEIAADGEAAVEAVRRSRFDLVLMDIQMPRMDGITATRLIRQLPGEAGQVPIVAMTANVLPRQVAEFLAAGMNGHVAKPVRQRELHAAVAAALPGRRAAPAPEAAAPEEEFDAATFEDVRQIIPPERLAQHLAQLETEAEAIAEASGGGPDVEARAHKIVSQAGMLGLVRLSRRARALEDACRDGGDRDGALAAFREAAGDVRRYARPLL